MHIKTINDIIYNEKEVIIVKVILLQDVKKQGKKDQIINVSDGYAKNFLIAKGLAVPCNESNENKLKRDLKNRKDAEDAKVEECEGIKKKLEKITIKFKAKTGKDGKMFGSISSKQIADELKALGYEVDKRMISCDHNIDSLGIHIVEVELHKKVIAKVNIQVS